MDSDDEDPVLSSNALDALKEFYADRDARLKQFEDLKAVAEDEHAAGGGEDAGVPAKLSMEAFTEDWNESQFWYSDETATVLAEELLVGTGPNSTIAVVSAPSVFVQLKNLLATTPAASRPKLYLLEYDMRFAVFPEFVFYDFKTPFKLPPNMKGTIDNIICDPPFLSDDCQTKAALTVRFLSKSWGTSTSSNRLILCTGERMSSLITTLYRPQGVKTTTYLPVHSKGLSNEFFCYANFTCGKWSFAATNPDSNVVTGSVLAADGETPLKESTAIEAPKASEGAADEPAIGTEAGTPKASEGAAGEAATGTWDTAAGAIEEPASEEVINEEAVVEEPSGIETVDTNQNQSSDHVAGTAPNGTSSTSTGGLVAMMLGRNKFKGDDRSTTEREDTSESEVE